MAQSSLPALLQERASQQPDAAAYTFIDYEIDPAGFAERLTWAQVHHRALVVAEELRLCGSVGDRAAILAPQGLDYIVAFLGALQAGFIRFLCRSRSSAFTINAFRRRCGIVRRPSFSRRPLPLTTSSIALATRTGAPRFPSSRSTCWTSIPPARLIRSAIPIPARRTSNTHRDRHANQPA